MAKFYANTYEKLKQELPKKRIKPVMVCLSTSCEPLMDFPEILETAFRTIKLLLEYDIMLMISTKAKVPERLLNLFSQCPEKVHVQVGLTTVDDRIRQVMEPNAGSLDAQRTRFRHNSEKSVLLSAQSAIFDKCAF